MFFPAPLRPISALMFVLAVAPLSAQDYDWGRKMLDRKDVRFGSVAKNADVVFKFNVKNIYKEDILISSLSTSCGCISWQDQARLPIRITSGNTEQVTIRLDTVRHQGDKNVTAFMTLTEPTRGLTSQLSFPVQGRIRQDVVLQTNQLNFGQVEQGRAMEHRLNVSYTGGRPDWKITQAKVNSPYLMTKVIEKSRGGGSANYEVILTLKGDAPVSRIADQMLVMSDDIGDTGYAVAVEAQVEPDIVVADVQFGQVTPGHPKSQNLVVRGKKPFKIEKIETAKPDESFKVKFNETVSQVHMVTVTFTPTAEQGVFEENFMVTVAGREQPVQFKAKGRVMDQSVTVAKPVVP